MVPGKTAAACTPVGQEELEAEGGPLPSRASVPSQAPKTGTPALPIPFTVAYGSLSPPEAPSAGPNPTAPAQAPLPCRHSGGEASPQLPTLPLSSSDNH